MAGVSSLQPVSGTAAEILELLRAWDADPDPEPLVIETSGSTGTPKQVQLSRDALRASALATHERLGGPGRWVLNLPPSYVAGVQVLYRCVVAGVEPVITEGTVGPAPAGRAYVSLVPTQLVRLLSPLAEDSQVELLTGYDAVLVGGGPLAPRVKAQALAAGIRVVGTYGMSETCGGCVYDGVPLDGVEMRIDAEGQVLLRGPMLFDGYLGEPRRTERVLRDGWFHTDDLGEITADGRLRVLGRADDVIISGGVKVPARAVATMIAAHGEISAVEVVGAPDEEWGERVVAVVVADGVFPLDEVRNLVRPRTWAPRQVVLLDQLPLLPNGKPDRVAIKELAARG